MTLAALLVAAGMVMVSCQKPAPSKDDSALVDDKTPGDDNNNDDNNGGNTGDNVPASLKGSSYYPIVVDATTFETIKDKVAADIRTQDGGDAASTRPLYVWNGYVGGEASGLNFYGNADGYMCLTVAEGAGWSGFGLFLKKEDPSFDKIKEITGDYYFHFAYKGPANVVHAIYPGWGTVNYQMSIGSGNAFVDQGKTFEFIQPLSGAFVPNEWNEYEIKVSDMGIDFTAAPAEEGGQNIFCGLSGGTAGVTLSLDAVFFYKK